MSMNEILQAMKFLPQFMEMLKKMTEEDKNRLVEQLGLQGEEKETALKIFTCFQEGRTLSPEERQGAMVLFTKALSMNNLDLSTLMNFTQQQKD